MSSEEAIKIDWEEKYRVMRKKLGELKNLRSDSVKADTENLRKKIEEHRKIHEISIKELRLQNEQLEARISDMKTAIQEIERLETTNNRLKQDIASKDSTLAVFMKFPLIRVLSVSKGTYEIACGKGNSFTFRLAKDKSYHYYPISVPNVVGLPDFVNQLMEFELTGLAEFCNVIQSSAKDLDF